ncbi:ribosome silencing factor [Moellerella wisconsensis]|uniref:Ribosomal silencing factor RsfS n=1 Tax=Moellerella wisconsensis TaxID=158849 RepID=A0A9Q8V4R5_9GAMM|nr:ribosome silencing factor [Moellerella wisconsensis]UNH25640.1 ribosome silencing factor [Moellerella wisconsensis]UNH28773.1 ribosome silencing factor [Moellerella wisconsensis]UNH31487.1 ribosome silencing factor [Moellerella wisconsensis]UNH43916.1 ribosome silencing factor [Moellerella wisconsensis]WJW83291.1 ribosome silencing factor [Moellerella wisconsensis]
MNLLQGTELQQFIIARLEDSKAEDMVTIDVRGKSSVTDCMIICTGTSSRHLASVADKLIDECRKNGLQPLGVEGQGVSDWIVVDLGEAIVHVMQDESRRMYELEKLWS